MTNTNSYVSLFTFSSRAIQFQHFKAHHRLFMLLKHKHSVAGGEPLSIGAASPCVCSSTFILPVTNSSTIFQSHKCVLMHIKHKHVQEIPKALNKSRTGTNGTVDDTEEKSKKKKRLK